MLPNLGCLVKGVEFKKKKKERKKEKKKKKGRESDVKRKRKRICLLSKQKPIEKSCLNECALSNASRCE